MAQIMVWFSFMGYALHMLNSLNVRLCLNIQRIASAIKCLKSMESIVSFLITVIIIAHKISIKPFNAWKTVLNPSLR